MPSIRQRSHLFPCSDFRSHFSIVSRKCETLAFDSKRRHLAYLMIPADLPGITLVPMNLLSGFKGGLFFDNLPVPVSCRIGPENEAWTTVATSNTEREHGGADTHRPTTVCLQLSVRQTHDEADEMAERVHGWERPFLTLGIALGVSRGEVARQRLPRETTE